MGIIDPEAIIKALFKNNPYWYLDLVINLK